MSNKVESDDSLFNIPLNSESGSENDAGRGFVMSQAQEMIENQQNLNTSIDQPDQTYDMVSGNNKWI